MADDGSVFAAFTIDARVGIGCSSKLLSNNLPVDTILGLGQAKVSVALDSAIPSVLNIGGLSIELRAEFPFEVIFNVAVASECNSAPMLPVDQVIADGESCTRMVSVEHDPLPRAAIPYHIAIECEIRCFPQLRIACSRLQHHSHLLSTNDSTLNACGIRDSKVINEELSPIDNVLQRRRPESRILCAALLKRHGHVLVVDHDIRWLLTWILVIGSINLLQYHVLLCQLVGVCQWWPICDAPLLMRLQQR
mmetsp:Transcript_54510/g.129984  ORF Transcript_54510/g.129984 Transcript_54510/m.129984 type:complete len:250 (+) Transcript_54510:766-1515(+)